VKRIVDLSMPVHMDMLTFPRVPPPALTVYESHEDFATRIGAAEYGVESLTASYLIVQNDHVVAPEQSNHTTSEAIGYGMLIAAAMGDKAQFDKFWSYAKANGASGGLMNWEDGQSGSATDADLDIAYAVLMAGAQGDEWISEISMPAIRESPPLARETPAAGKLHPTTLLGT